MFGFLSMSSDYENLLCKKFLYYQDRNHLDVNTKEERGKLISYHSFMSGGHKQRDKRS